MIAYLKRWAAWYLVAAGVKLCPEISADIIDIVVENITKAGASKVAE